MIVQKFKNKKNSLTNFFFVYVAKLNF